MMKKRNEWWDESRMVYCTDGKYPQPRKPEFSPRAGNLVGKYGCAHYKSDPCSCRCHQRKKSWNDIAGDDAEMEYRMNEVEEK